MVIGLISGLGGAVIGSFGTLATVYLQLGAQARRERIQQAAQLALEERKLLLDIAEKENQRIALPPMSLAMGHYIEILRLFEKGPLSKEKLREINEKYDELSEYMAQLEEARRKSHTKADP